MRLAVVAGLLTALFAEGGHAQEAAPKAHDLYARAGASLSPSFRKAQTSVPDLKTQRILVGENQESLNLVRQALVVPFRFPLLHSPEDIERAFPLQSDFRQLARLLVLESRVRQADGDLAGSASSLLDALQLGAEVPRGGPLIAMLVGRAIEALARRELWTLLPRLDTQTARQAATRLHAITGSAVTAAQTLEAEKASGLGLMESQWEAPAKTSREFQLLRANYIRFLDAAIEAARQPYSPIAASLPGADDPLMQVLTPVLAPHENRIRREQNAALNALLLTALALRAFQAERGIFPDTLAELSPGFMPAVPADPFAPDSPLRYKRDGDIYHLYSLGPDADDDGGTPLPLDRRPVKPQSQGDIVAGTNF